jgi:DNA-directed RNA polymerase subunit RPC12/RpoP
MDSAHHPHHDHHRRRDAESYPGVESNDLPRFRPKQANSYRCLKCSATFESPIDLKTHRSVHLLDCDYCDRSFSIRSHLDRHLEEEHKINIARIEEEEEEEEEEDHSGLEGQLMTATTAPNVIDHDELLLDEEDSGSLRQVGGNFASDVLIEQLEGCYRCKVCRKVVTARSDMQKHVRRHTVSEYTEL